MISAPLLAAALTQVAQAAPFDYTQQTPISTQDHTQGYEFDPLQHLPGISPYDPIHTKPLLRFPLTHFVWTATSTQ
jgi:hypothetical protein